MKTMPPTTHSGHPACFFCKGPMTYREDPPGVKALVCACGERVMVDTRVDPKGLATYGPTAFIPPRRKYWRKKIAIEWAEFELYLTHAYFVLGYYSDDTVQRRVAWIEREIVPFMKPLTWGERAWLWAKLILLLGLLALCLFGLAAGHWK